MESRKIVFRETGIVAVGQLIGVGVMLGVFALIGRFDASVLLGGVLGGLLALANFFFMALGTCLAADKAEAQDVKGGKATVQTSYLLRLVLLFVILFACIKSGLCNVFSMVIPLLFVRPTLSIGEFFRKSGDKKA